MRANSPFFISKLGNDLNCLQVQFQPRPEQPPTRARREHWYDVSHDHLGHSRLYLDGDALFCEQQSHGSSTDEDGINDFVMQQQTRAVNWTNGSRAALWYELELEPGKGETVRLRCRRTSFINLERFSRCKSVPRAFQACCFGTLERIAGTVERRNHQIFCNNLHGLGFVGVLIRLELPLESAVHLQNPSDTAHNPDQDETGVVPGAAGLPTISGFANPPTTVGAGFTN